MPNQPTKKPTQDPVSKPRPDTTPSPRPPGSNDQPIGYGNPHSSCCYDDGGYNTSPNVLEQANGAAVLIGTERDVSLENGISRFFIVNGDAGLTIFNPYLILDDGRNRDS